jgi:hypothetical protein
MRGLSNYISRVREVSVALTGKGYGRRPSRLRSSSDGLGAKGFIQVMIDKKHPMSIRALIDVMGATSLSAPKALVFDSSNPFPVCAISEGGDAHTTGRLRE